MADTQSHHGGGGGGSRSAASAADVLWGAASLKERFGNVSGRELQEHLFKMYQAGKQHV